MPKCADQFCAEFRFDDSAALAEGWREVSGKIYCGLHYYGPYREAKKEKIRADISAQKRRHEEAVAKKMFSAADYRAWDQFQSDLADFHKKTGKLAPKVLREMMPGTWIQEFKQKGRIDVQKTADWYANAEKTKTERLKGL